ncbi:MAG: UbiA family prenyltransferase [Gammaproteobacteria bacterium]|nr:UbiA family prenyltransferase [Gammaproteobacteria bacterium]
MKITPYIHLFRLHKPIGTLLLWFPTAWALWLMGPPPIRLIGYFFSGTFIMRGVGCIVNDIADRHIDPHVERTKNRPLATRQITLQSAIILLVALLCTALLILIQLPFACFSYALIGLALTVIYPFCKRFFEAPQFILGLAFSMGIPMAYAALGITPNATTYLLILLNFLWIIAYDTIYAMADKVDDLEIGVKSTAILFASQDKNIVFLLQLATQILWLILASALHFNLIFYIIWSIGCGLFMHQQWVIRGSNPNYLRTFSSNGWYGFIFWIALILQH